MDWELVIRIGVIAAGLVGGGVLFLKAMRTKPDPALARRYGPPVRGGGPGMAIFLIILGVVFGFLGACNLVQAIGDGNQMRQLGGLIIAAVFGVPGVVALIYGIKRAGRPRVEGGNTRKCPHCAEMIKPDAKVCRHCQRDVPAMEATSQWG